jgi:uncharacterized protein (TIGR02145 family)
MKKIYLGVIGLVSVVFLFVWCNDSGIEKVDGVAEDFLNSFITNTSNNGGSDNGGSGGGGSFESVLIGGTVWMKRNLNIETENSWCYDNAPDNCANFGRLYNWSDAKKVCPSGWRLPDDADWRHLAESAGGWENAGKKLKSTNGWNNNGGGTDDFGFTALPGGYRAESSGKFNKIGDESLWWTATAKDNKFAYYWTIAYDFDDMQGESQIVSNGYSVRCVKKD